MQNARLCIFLGEPLYLVPKVCLTLSQNKSYKQAGTLCHFNAEYYTFQQHQFFSWLFLFSFVVTEQVSPAY